MFKKMIYAAALILASFVQTAAATTIVTVPGGTNGQFQYNCSGRFCGVTLSTSAVALSTAQLRTDLNAEIAARIAADFSIGASTKQTNIDLVAEIAARIAADFTIGASTKATNEALDAEIARAIAAEASKVDKNAPDQVNLSTVTTKFDAVGTSTFTLAATKLSSPTVSGTVGQVIGLASDGTPTWTTPSSGGASLTSTNTWSGAQLFLSSPSAGAQVYTSTAITGAGTLLDAHRSLWINDWTVVASTRFYAGTLTTGFQGLKQGVLYRASLNFITTSIGQLNIKWNSAASGYKYASHGHRSDNSALTSASESTTQCVITFGSAIPADGEVQAAFYFRISEADDTKVWAWGSLATQNSTPSLFVGNTSCFLDHSATITSVQFIAAGGMKGAMQLSEFAPAAN